MSWEKAEQNIEKGPYRALVTVVIFITVAAAFISAIGYVGGWFNEAAQVAKEELGPRALNEKYKLFKQASASLDALESSLLAQQGKVGNFKTLYGDNATSWPEDVRSQYNKADTEYRGMLMNYNRTAADYNSLMAQWHTRLANAGMLPEGAPDTPRREFRIYKNQ